MVHNLNAAIGVFSNLEATEIAAIELLKSGYDLNKISMSGGLVVNRIIAPNLLGDTLTNLGVPSNCVQPYENALKANKFVLIVQGDPQEVEKAEGIMQRKRALFANYHKGIIDMDSEVA